jgi:hypothetical protein
VTGQRFLEANPPSRLSRFAARGPIPGLRSESQLEATKLYIGLIDERMEIHHDHAYQRARDLPARRLLAGPSAG